MINVKDAVIKNGNYEYDSDEEAEYKDSYMYIYDGLMSNEAVKRYIEDILGISATDCNFYDY